MIVFPLVISHSHQNWRAFGRLLVVVPYASMLAGWLYLSPFATCMAPYKAWLGTSSLKPSEHLRRHPICDAPPRLSRGAAQDEGLQNALQSLRRSGSR
jgi:hypothetical protein